MTLISHTNDLVWLEATPTVDTSAYAAGDLIGGKLTLANAAKAEGGGGLVLMAGLIDMAAQEALIDVVLFNADPENTTFTDNAAFDIADADLANAIKPVQVFDWTGFNDNSIGWSEEAPRPFVCAAGETALYAALVSRGTPTFAAATDLRLRVAVLRA